MRQVAGFSTYDDLGSPYKLNISSRGFYSSPVVGLPQGVAVFLDGVRMNEPEASQVNFDLLPMDHIQRIEVLSGNGSLLGRNALGGAINLVTARGTGPTQSTIELSGGSFGAFRGEANVSGLTDRRLRLVRRRQLQPRGRLARRDRRRGVQRLRERRQARRDAAASASRACTPTPTCRRRARCRSPSSSPARTPTSAPTTTRISGRTRARCRGTPRSAPAEARRRVYFRRHRAERFNANQPRGPRRLRHLLQHQLRLHRGLPLGHAAGR